MNKILQISLLMLLSGYTCGQIPSEGLVGWFPFNGNANDESFYSNNGTVNLAQLTTNRFDSVNSAYQFSGSSTYIDVPHASQYLDFIASGFSVSFWFKASNIAGEGTIIEKYDKGTGFQIQLSDDGRMLMGIREETGGNSHDLWISSISSYNDNIWHHGVYVWNSNKILRMYVDKEMIAFNNLPTITSIDNGFLISEINFGRLYFDATGIRYFAGLIDDVRIYNRALTDEEIFVLFDENAAPTITVQPVSQTICLGEPQVTLGVTSHSSVPLFYQWYKDGVMIPNAQQNIYVIYDLETSDAGGYYCAVTNDFGTVLSNSATLAVVEVPVPAILGSSEVLEWSTQTYSITQTTGSTYNFNVTNGNILNTFPNYITVQWGSKGTGQVICTETNAMGCTSNQSILNVSIGALGVDEPNFDKLVISPNPTTSIINILSEILIDKVVVYNSLGKRILEKGINDSEISIDLTSFGKGVYYFSLKIGEKTVNKKVIVL
ncbi:MAG: LamG-like jellyroll fold domain-containing protein [Lentimicrobium sp.]